MKYDSEVSLGSASGPRLPAACPDVQVQHAVGFGHRQPIRFFTVGYGGRPGIRRQPQWIPLHKRIRHVFRGEAANRLVDQVELLAVADEFAEHLDAYFDVRVQEGVKATADFEQGLVLSAAELVVTILVEAVHVHSERWRRCRP